MLVFVPNLRRIPASHPPLSRKWGLGDSQDLEARPSQLFSLAHPMAPNDKDKPIKMEMPFCEFKSVPKCKQRLGQKISPPTEMASAPQSWWRGSDKGQRGDNGVIGLLIIGLQLTKRDPNENDSTILFVQHERLDEIGSLLRFGYLASSSQYHYHYSSNKIFASSNIDYLVTTFANKTLVHKTENPPKNAR